MNSWGQNIRLSLFGESHGPAIGIVIDGLPPGLSIDMDFVQEQMARRAPGRNPWSTPRKEADEVRVLSGMIDGHATGAPLCAVIENTSAHSKDYDAIRYTPRPGHADWPAFVKYAGYADMRGGGHFSGRLTAPLLFAGAIAMEMIGRHGIAIGSHIRRIYDMEDAAFDPAGIDSEMLRKLSQESFPVLDAPVSDRMIAAIMEAKAQGDSVGGIIETAAANVPAGLGSPFFGSLESRIAGLVYSIPAVKSISFGAGAALAEMRGSAANDPYRIQGGAVRTATNHNGGILGGISTGMPIVFTTAIKPTPSISQEQKTVDLMARKDTTIAIEGRHDPCIVPRALPVIEGALALALLDEMMEGPYEW
mgnify:CR=1 FL=1